MSAKNTLTRAIEDYKESQDFKNKILEGGYFSYCIGYEDGRDAVKKLYSNLDLSSIVAPSLREETVEEIVPTEEVTSAAPVCFHY